MHYVYVLHSETIKRLYVGSTRDLKRRLIHHNRGLNRWSKRGVPWRVIYVEKFIDKKSALQRERTLKTGKGRAFINAKLAKVVTARV